MKELRYIDEPIYDVIRKPLIARALDEAWGHKPKAVVVTKGTRRIHIDWMKPDGNGGLVPKGQPMNKWSDQP